MRKKHRISSDEYYEKFYVDILRSGIVGFVTNFGQRQMERKFRENDLFDKVIELGAGNGEHFRFVKHKFISYTETDIRLDNLVENTPSVEGRLKLLLNAEQLSELSNDSYDRVIATCLLSHLSNPTEVLKEWRRITKPGGYLSLWVACEPGLLLRFSRYFTSNFIARIRGIDHLNYLYREHQIHYLTCKYAINEVFEKDSVHSVYFPFKYFSWNFNYWKIYTIRKSVPTLQNP